MIRSLIFFLLNNRVTNRLLILVGRDGFIKNFTNNWRELKYDSSKSLQENVGFSHRSEVEAAILRIKSLLKDIREAYLHSGNSVLDIGCGVGLYLKDFSAFQMHGSDLSQELLNKCSQVVPEARLYHGDYLQMKFPPSNFQLIFSISVMEYIPPSKIRGFFRKISDELVPGGIVVIQYPHALTIADKWIADLSYVSYTPEFIESVLPVALRVIQHKHSFDDRSVRGVDTKRYGSDKIRDFRDGMILVAVKT